MGEVNPGGVVQNLRAVQIVEFDERYIWDRRSAEPLSGQGFQCALSLM
jgi:hypothetical protein